MKYFLYNKITVGKLIDSAKLIPYNA